MRLLIQARFFEKGDDLTYLKGEQTLLFEKAVRP